MIQGHIENNFILGGSRRGELTQRQKGFDWRHSLVVARIHFSLPLAKEGNIFVHAPSRQANERGTITDSFHFLQCIHQERLITR